MLKQTINNYIAKFPTDVQEKLEKVRATIQKAAPEAVESFGYGVPAFDLDGKHLVYFAAFKNHLGFYPTGQGIEDFRQELSEYETSKGTVKFPFKKPIPFDLITKITKYRVKQVKEGKD